MSAAVFPPGARPSDIRTQQHIPISVVLFDKTFGSTLTYPKVAACPETWGDNGQDRRLLTGIHRDGPVSGAQIAIFAVLHLAFALTDSTLAKAIRMPPR